MRAVDIVARSPRLRDQERRPRVWRDPPSERGVRAPTSVEPKIGNARALTSMWGFGDCLFIRAILDELLRVGPVALQSNYRALYHDFVGRGLTLVAGRGKPRVREEGLVQFHVLPGNSKQELGPRIGYNSQMIRTYGSLLAAQFMSVGLKMPARPNFTLPIPEQWRESAHKLIASWNIGGKPLLIYRPLVLNPLHPQRHPDADTYAALYDSIRGMFFTVSLADFTSNSAGWDDKLVGRDAPADVKLHHGEVGFETLAALYAEAALVFAAPGYPPVLAQAVGTPVVVVYGGNESFRTTNSVGAHLAPTLPIEPDRPCECHDPKHACNKHITMGPALEKLRAFVDEQLRPDPKVLIFGTCYVDSEHRAKLLAHWRRLHSKLNPDCDLLLVDSASPLGVPYPSEGDKVAVFDFRNNVGHLSRNGPKGPASSGRDGWGRAFCEGLRQAMDEGYDYVVHIEGDSLFKQPVMPIIRKMRAEGIDCASTPVEGSRRKETGWVETGLMFFRTGYVKDSEFIRNYNWETRSSAPTPERAIFQMLDGHLTMLPLRAERGNKSDITVENVRALDWVTHCWEQDEIYDRFVADVLPKEVMPLENNPVVALPQSIKLNLGCGKNRLDGWSNHDADVDIIKRLKWGDGTVSFINIEHCLEHVTYEQAISFLREAMRVLQVGGVIRICVPSIERVMRHADAEYLKQVKPWAKEENKQAAIGALLNCHGHKAPWTDSLLETTLFYVGFKDLARCELQKSSHSELCGVEGHSMIIGENNNWVEACIWEGTK